MLHSPEGLKALNLEDTQDLFAILNGCASMSLPGRPSCLAVASVLLALQADLFSDCLSGRTVTGILPLLQRRRYLMISSSASLLSYRQLVSCPLVVLPVTASRTVLSMQESMVCMDWEVCRFFIADKYRACGLASQQWARLLAQADARAVVMCETK